MPTKRAQGGFYAVRTGRKTGVFKNWSDCEEQTKGFPKARYKKFATFQEAQFFALGILPPEVSNANASMSNSERSLADPKTNKRPRSPASDIDDESDYNVAYSDGACKGNGKVGSVAGIGVWWGPDDPRNLAERCPGDQTNNRAELIAILRVLETTPISTKPLVIRSDSRYSIDCLKTWIFKWKANGFRNAQGEAVKNAGIIRCTSIQLDIRARYQQKILLQYVKGHSGDVGNDGADALANRGTLLPPVKERDWEALEIKLSEQFEHISVETSGIEPVPMEVQDTDDVVENTAIEISSKMRGTSHEHHDRIAMAVAASSPFKPTLYPTATEAILRSSSRSPSNLLPASPTPQDEEREVVAVSPAQTPTLPVSAQSPSMPLESSATVSKTDLENIRNKKISVKVIYALPPYVPGRYEEVNFNDYTDCVLDDDDLAKELSSD
ncbi:ribonuclease H-like protein [Phlegmacium glaucopus]|nr:ribonuclease H-like protein [Phlegmacium glaucopus]